jgi:hypothetical protein
MNIRSISNADKDAIEAIYAKQPAKYGLPDKMISGFAVIDEDDKPRICLMARETVEIYAVFDPTFETPAWRMIALELLIAELKKDVFALGYNDGYCFIADDVPKSYIRRLMNLGARKMVVTCLHFLKGEI